MEPRVFDRGKVKQPEELLRMPKFWVSGEEADAIVTGVMSLTKEQVPLAAQKQLSADERYAEKGMRLVRDVQLPRLPQDGRPAAAPWPQVIKDQLEQSGRRRVQAPALSPPHALQRESQDRRGLARADRLAARVPEGPLATRSGPGSTLRMPTFHFTRGAAQHAHARLRLAGQGALSRTPRWPQLDAGEVAAGHDLFDRWQCIKCHVVAGKLPRPGAGEHGPRPGQGARSACGADWLTEWLADPGRIQPGTRMPAELPRQPGGERLPRGAGRRPEEADRGGARVPADAGPRPARGPACPPLLPPAPRGGRRAQGQAREQLTWRDGPTATKSLRKLDFGAGCRRRRRRGGGGRPGAGRAGRAGNRGRGGPGRRLSWCWSAPSGRSRPSGTDSPQVR